jgi:uncharacterized protein (TIGR03067 family)
MQLALVFLAPILFAAGADDPKDDRAKIQGTWKVVEVVFKGQTIPEEQSKEMRFVFTEDKMTIMGFPGRDKREYTYSLDPAATPRAIDPLALDGPFKDKKRPAIYELDGDSLKVCIPSKETKDRPTEFKSPRDSNLGLFVLRRVKTK